MMWFGFWVVDQAIAAAIGLPIDDWGTLIFDLKEEN